jgi:hypothetical protein
MAVIAYNNRSFTQNTWTVMYDGSSDFAMTSFSAFNLSEINSIGVAFAIGDGTIVSGSNTAFDANNDIVTANTDGVLLNDTLGFGEVISWSSDSGKVIIPAGKQIVVAFSGGNAEVNFFGLEI